MTRTAKHKEPISANCARCNAPMGLPIGAYGAGECTSCGATYRIVGGTQPYASMFLNGAPILFGIVTSQFLPVSAGATNFWIVMTVVVLAAVFGQIALFKLNKSRRAEWSFEQK